MKSGNEPNLGADAPDEGVGTRAGAGAVEVASESLFHRESNTAVNNW